MFVIPNEFYWEAKSPTNNCRRSILNIEYRKRIRTTYALRLLKSMTKITRVGYSVIAGQRLTSSINQSTG